MFADRLWLKTVIGCRKSAICSLMVQVAKRGCQKLYENVTTILRIMWMDDADD